MKTLRLSRSLCLAIGFVGLVLASSATEDENAVRAVVASFDQAVNAKDAIAFARVFHADADFTNVVGISAHGRKAIEEFHRPLFEGDGTTGISSFKNAVLTIVNTQVRFIRPDVASVDIRWTQTGAVLNGKPAGLRKGLLSLLVTKAKGEWGIAVMHNMNLPADPPRPR
jgi:uncharacterized protein (TIGR02246 family)